MSAIELQKAAERTTSFQAKQGLRVHATPVMASCKDYFFFNLSNVALGVGLQREALIPHQQRTTVFREMHVLISRPKGHAPDWTVMTSVMT